jgi:hypothetical protein
VATILGLKVPNHRLISIRKDEAVFPKTWIRKIVELNGTAK